MSEADRKKNLRFAPHTGRSQNSRSLKSASLEPEQVVLKKKEVACKSGAVQSGHPERIGLELSGLRDWARMPRELAAVRRTGERHLSG